MNIDASFAKVLILSGEALGVLKRLPDPDPDGPAPVRRVKPIRPGWTYRAAWRNAHRDNRLYRNLDTASPLA